MAAVEGVTIAVGGIELFETFNASDGISGAADDSPVLRGGSDMVKDEG